MLEVKRSTNERQYFESVADFPENSVADFPKDFPRSACKS